MRDPPRPGAGLRAIAALVAALTVTVVMLVTLATVLVLWFVGIVALLRWAL